MLVHLYIKKSQFFNIYFLPLGAALCNNETKNDRYWNGIGILLKTNHVTKTAGMD
jgi:hypothetical protein